MEFWANIQRRVKAAACRYTTTPILHHSHPRLPSPLPRSPRLPLTLILLIALAFAPDIKALTNTTDYAKCFIDGEESKYKVSWMGLPLAWSQSTTEAFYENDERLIRITMTAQNYAAYSAIYKVNNKTEVVIDPENGLPRTLDIIQNEGSRHNSSITTFNHGDLSAVYIDRMAKTTNTVEISENTRDVFSFLYTSRVSTPEKLSQQTQKIYVNGKIYDLNVKIRKEKKQKVPEHGKVPCIQLEPIAEFDGLFLRQGRLFAWISKTDLQMITLMEAKVPVGKIKVRLQSVSGVEGGFWNNRK
jgi:hypothetical protein